MSYAGHFSVEKIGGLSLLLLAPTLCFWRHAIVRAASMLAAFGLMIAALVAQSWFIYVQHTKALVEGQVTQVGVVSELAATLSGSKKGVWLHNGHAFALTFVGKATNLQVAPGDRLQISAPIRAFSPALLPYGFDGQSYGYARGLLGSISVSEPGQVRILQASAERMYVASARQWVRSRLETLITPREQAVLLALIMGDTKLFDPLQLQIYRSIGATHLLAVSGLQVSLLALLVFQILIKVCGLIRPLHQRDLTRPIASLACLLFVSLYVMFCDMPPSAARAGMMSGIYLVARWSTWRTHALDIFGASGMLLLLLWPQSIVDVSFWLSFAAVFALIWAEAIVQRLSPQHKGWLTLLCASSFSVAVVTTPLCAYFFGEIAVSSCLVNLILVPVAGLLQGPAIALGLLGAITSSNTLAVLGAACAGLIESLSDGLSQLLGFVWVCTVWDIVAVYAFVAVSFVIVLLFKKRPPWLWRWVLCCGLLLFLIVDFSPRPLKVQFLPVGHGDAALVRFPSGQHLLVDGGGSLDSAWDPGARIVVPHLKRLGVRHLDVVAITHPDLDHLGGLFALFEHFSIGQIWMIGTFDSNPLMAKFLQRAKSYQIPIHDVSNWQEWTAGTSRIRFLHPDRANITQKRSNNSSLVMQLIHEHQSVLLTGDIEKEAETSLLRRYQDVRSTIVKAPHHGSSSSSTDAFIKAVAPNHVVFCADSKGQWGFPHQEVIKRYQDAKAQSWNTSTHGLITVVMGRDFAQILPYNPAP